MAPERLGLLLVGWSMRQTAEASYREIETSKGLHFVIRIGHLFDRFENIHLSQSKSGS
jgi:hypothetical protein